MQPRPRRAADAPTSYPRAGRASVPACTTDSRHSVPIAPNLLARRFVATGEGWLYPAAALDLASRKIVGWAMRDHMRTELPLAALMMAAQRQRLARGLICHSDLDRNTRLAPMSSTWLRSAPHLR